jgi:iron uptake system component EfeO
MRHRPSIAGIAAAGALALILTGCVPNGALSKTSAASIGVKASDTGCELSSSTAPSGPITFTISNSGSDVTELEILAEDRLQIVGEKENVGPGTTPSYVAQLEPGTYYTSCKPGMVGVGESKLVVTDSGVKVNANASDKTLIAQAVTNYVSYAKDQVGELVTDTTAFVAACESGNIALARSLYPGARSHYERIEPLAEKFPDLDAALDVREADLSAGDPWTGWHRIEKDLWPPESGYTALSAAERATLGDTLVADTRKLYTLLYTPSFSVSLSDVSNGAIALMDEVAAGKITGEEEIWSHTDLWDFQANIEGARIAFQNVRGIAERTGASGTKLVGQIDADFETLAATLGQYGSIEAGYRLYGELSTVQIRELSDQVNALAEPLSRLTAVVLA